MRTHTYIYEPDEVSRIGHCSNRLSIRRLSAFARHIYKDFTCNVHVASSLRYIIAIYRIVDDTFRDRYLQEGYQL